MGRRPDDDGTPQPASQAMSQREATDLFQRTKGQLVPFLAADGKWYVYEVNPVELPARGLPVVRER